MIQDSGFKFRLMTKFQITR